MPWFLFWIILSVLAGVYADKLSRNGVIWGFLSLIVSPIITFIALLIIGDSEEGKNNIPGLKRCLFCAEFIREEAIKCKYCGEAQSSTRPENLNEKDLNALIDRLQNKK